jgi:hypothetical protein
MQRSSARLSIALWGLAVFVLGLLGVPSHSWAQG